MTQPYQMASHLATSLKSFLSANAPPEMQIDEQLQTLDRIVVKGEQATCCLTKLHRTLGYIMGLMVALKIATVDQIREMVLDAKLHFAEENDYDLDRHHDPEDPFFLDIGGEG